MFKGILFSLIFISSASYAIDDVNGCPNANLSGMWSVAMDWNCSGRSTDIAWFLDTDGRGFNDSGQHLKWHCEGEKIILDYQGDASHFTGIYGDGTTMSGQVSKDGQLGCWVAAHLYTINKDPQQDWRSRWTNPGSYQQLPPPIYNPSPQSYMSPSSPN